MSATKPEFLRLLKDHDFKILSRESVEVWLEVQCIDCLKPVAINELKLNLQPKEIESLPDYGLTFCVAEKPLSGYILHAGGPARCKECLDKWKVMNSYFETRYDERVLKDG